MSHRWDNCVPSQYEGPYPMIRISDEVESYCSPLKEGETVEQACADFERTYETGDWQGEVSCAVDVYHDPDDRVQQDGFSFTR